MELIESFVKSNPCYTAGKRINVKGLVLHSVGCPQPKAEVFIKQFDSSNAKVCVHAFIDANTGAVYQTLPWEYKAWHCGGNANSTHIGVEMCEPSCMKYTGGMNFECSDEAKAKEMVMRTLQSAVELFASLCRQYRLNPLEDGVIISHKEGHDRGVASGHGDPDHLFNGLHMDYSMNDFRKAVAEALHTGESGSTAEEAESAPAGAESAGGQESASSESTKQQESTSCGDGEMSVSERGVELVAKYEGCRLEAYKCPAGVWTIGYGHTTGVEAGQTLPTIEAAKALLKEDLQKYGDYVNKCVKKGQISFPLTQNQFDALTSFCYNCGNGSLQKLVTDRDAATVADKLLLYNKGGGRVLAGLTKRREEERALFLT
ncbi:MAG: N-acetylmuramoyl-L-alanine amidase [Roseburia sp.]|nr:N-acetylmuramoyl-L-alanine amidase [Ruminococcus sp.]MCM1156402.1 N-acetylmuramoyl-L-alanine amidase [Roseburia sp.]MCM1242238.1 N-acetylmuramoyl-L-alanine amidase [Roseburia sp.]